MMRMIRPYAWVSIFLISISAGVFAGERTGPATAPARAEEPAALKEWKDKVYTVRYFLRVEAPGEAGAINLQNDPILASVLLPLKVVDPASTKHRFEPVLLVGEDGVDQPVYVRANGDQAEVVFRTRPGLRRFCLYAGSTLKTKNASSDMAASEIIPLQVRMKGWSAETDLSAPYTLEKFKKSEEAQPAGLGRKQAFNIDEPESTFFSIRVDQFGRNPVVTNPERYSSVYEAFLRAPVSGQYRFAVDTLGATHLLIDGVPVVSAETGDPQRKPFALEKTIDLVEGIHRVTLYYTEANTEAGRTNVDLQRFGVRLHWQPPFAKDLICIPPQAFPKALPAVVTRAEKDSGEIPFIHVETLGQVIAAAHLGDDFVREQALLVTRSVGAPEGAIVTICIGDKYISAKASDAVWVPVGKEVQVIVSDTKYDAKKNLLVPTRTITIPSLRETNPKELLNVEGELVIKSAPEFLYPDETGQIHMEAMLSPPPMLVYKERLEQRMLPPPPRPKGQFRVIGEITDVSGATQLDIPIYDKDGTPTEGKQKRLRFEVPGNIEEKVRAGTVQIRLKLFVGDVEIQTLRLRVLHSTSAWNATVLPGPDSLLYTEEKDEAKAKKLAEAENDPVATGQFERVLMIIPHEDEAEYRKYAPLKALTKGTLGKNALFIGDPLIEGVNQKNYDDQLGVAKPLAKMLNGYALKSVAVTGPHRYLPVFRIIAALDKFVRVQPDQKVPELAILCLGGGDVARQTPLHTFERALDALIDRLRSAGARKVLVVGVIPEPCREKQCAPYQERVLDVLRQHHIDCADVFAAWKTESDWVRYFSADGSDNTPVYGPVPNAQARENIAKLIKDRL